MKKRFSIKTKLLLIFGLLLIISLLFLGLLAMNLARKAVTEKVSIHLTDKAQDIAEVIDGRITAIWQFLEGIARAPILRDVQTSIDEKTLYLFNEVKNNKNITNMQISTIEGNTYSYKHPVKNIKEQQWFQETIKGSNTFSAPFKSKIDGSLICIVAVPIYNENKETVGTLSAVIDGLYLIQFIKDIVIAQTGYCYILGAQGNTLAHKNIELVKAIANSIDMSKTNKALVDLATFQKKAIEMDKSEIGYYSYKGINSVASYAKMKLLVGQ